MTAHFSLPLPLPSPRSRFGAMRHALLLGCALAGLCVAAPGGRADAQAFNANPMTVFGGVIYDRATPGVETITIDTPTAIINWTPPSVPAIFLPAGNTATFINGPNVTNYAVLNRILTLEPVRFDGTVLGLIGDLAAGTAVPGGTIVFSSPGGIIIGSTAVFDVGNLVLTSLNVVDDGAGNFGGVTGDYQFNGGAAAPNAAVITEAGARINALGQGSYVAMVAPRVVHGGAVRVNGSAAYVAGEQVQLRVNSGLFDIIVDVGSDNATPLIHTGSTGGPAATAADDFHRIYMVAVPKNQAITAILEGSVGFDDAVFANVENGAIVLSAGFNIVGGEVDRFGDSSPPPKPGLAASFHIRGGTVRSDLSGFAVTDMLASGQTTGSLDFLQDVSLFGGARAHLFAGAGQNVTVAGNALVSAARRRSTDGSINLVGGEALIFAQGGGALIINGNATVDASGQGAVDPVSSIAGSGTGGTAGVFADQGLVRIDGSLAVLATGTGGMLDFSPNQGGAGTGGDTFLEGRNGGTVTIGAGLNMDASGTASQAGGLVPVAGAVGTGGDVRVGTTGNGRVTVTGPATLTANGTGGEVLSGPGNVGGTGQGGNIFVTVGGGTVTFSGASTMSANAFGGAGPDGGVALGGDVILDVTNGEVVFGGAADMDATALGGDANALGGRGGDGTGGNVELRARTGAAGSRISGGAIDISVQGTGGTGGNATVSVIGGRGGDGRGGGVVMLAEAGNGALQFNAVTVLADGLGGRGGGADTDGDGGRGGDGAGGDIQVGTAGGPALPAPTGSARFGSVSLRATGTGGEGGGGGGNGGNAAGGSVGLLAAGALTQVSGLASLEANANGGAGGAAILAGGPVGASGQAAGGQVLLDASGPSGTLTAGTVTGTASAVGGPGAGNTPGEWHVRATGGAAINLANLTLAATANGTPGIPAFSSIEAFGGNITVTQLAALSTLGEIRVIGAGAGRIAGGTLGLTAGGDVVITHANPAQGAFTIDVANLIVAAGDDFSAGAGVVTRASNLTDIRAVGDAIVAGRILGRQILIGSSDIDIQATGAIGDAGTELATLLLNTTGQLAVLGGAAQGPGYTLTNAEAGRIRSATLRILAPALANGISLLVRDLTLTGGGAATGIGILEINTPGIARVEGAVLMTNAAPANGISFTAGERLEVVTPAGSLRVRDAAGAPGGNLLLASDNIWVASPAILDRLLLDPDYAERDADLLSNGGIEEPRGYVEAGGVVLATGATLFVQNSGPAFSPAFAGITVGEGGLIVLPTGTRPAVVTAFGRRLNPDGSVVVGAPFFFEVNFQPGGGAAGGGGYTAGSTFNTCIIVTRQCGGGPANPGPGGPDPITGPTGGSDSILLPPGADEDDLVDTSFSAEGLIEEPVTSGGESSLWADCVDADEDEDGDGDCDED